MTRALLAALVLELALFAAFPGIDHAVSGAFFRAGTFPLAHVPVLETVRDLIWDAAIALCLLCAALWAAVGLRARRAASDWRPFAFGTLTFALGPILVVHSMKELWHRARPRDVLEFGGGLDFTLPGRIAGQCASNCSFPSGETAGAAAMGIVLLVLLARRRRVLAAVVGAVAIGGGLLRIAVGAHWLSDVVTAWLLTGLIARLVWLALGMRDAAPPRRALLRADLAALGRRIVPGKW